MVKNISACGSNVRSTSAAFVCMCHLATQTEHSQNITSNFKRGVIHLSIVNGEWNRLLVATGARMHGFVGSEKRMRLKEDQEGV